MSISPRRFFKNIVLPNEANFLMLMFKANGHALYLVGGAVRDALLGKSPKDFDFATDALPEVTVELLMTIKGIKLLEIGRAFGIIKAQFPSGFECEIATFRTDVGVGRRPDAVEFSTIEQDVLRRDLTINALFYDLHQQQVVDYVGGVYDLENNIVRTVGDPKERFDEDRLRIMRAVRFAAQVGSELNRETEDAILQSDMEGVSAERIRDELIKALAKAKSVTHLVMLLDRLELWPQILPGISISLRMTREVRHLPTLFALLTKSVSHTHLNTAMRNMKYTVEEIRQVAFLRTFTYLSWYVGVASDVVKMYKEFETSKLTMEQVRLYADFRRSPEPYIVDAFCKYKPSVSGEQLLNEGFSGKELGVELERREALVFNRLIDESNRKHTGTQGRLDIDV